MAKQVLYGGGAETVLQGCGSQHCRPHGLRACLLTFRREIAFVPVQHDLPQSHFTEMKASSSALRASAVPTATAEEAKKT